VEKLPDKGRVEPIKAVIEADRRSPVLLGDPAVNLHVTCTMVFVFFFGMEVILASRN